MDVVMKRLCEEDLEMVMEWRMRPYVTQYMNTDPVLTIEKQIEWFERIKKRDDQMNWIVNVDGRPVGLINVFDIDRINLRCSWGYYIAEKEARSLQLALFLEWNLYDYVFDVLKLHKLCNETFVDNKQVIKLHIICGGKEDGVIREHIYKNGEFHDVSVGSILSDEWIAKRKTVKYERFFFE
jgi:hypothetical protein